MWSNTSVMCLRVDSIILTPSQHGVLLYDVLVYNVYVGSVFTFNTIPKYGMVSPVPPHTRLSLLEYSQVQQISLTSTVSKAGSISQRSKLSKLMVLQLLKALLWFTCGRHCPNDPPYCLALLCNTQGLAQKRSQTLTKNSWPAAVRTQRINKEGSKLKQRWFKGQTKIMLPLILIFHLHACAFRVTGTKKNKLHCIREHAW